MTAQIDFDEIFAVIKRRLPLLTPHALSKVECESSSPTVGTHPIATAQPVEAIESDFSERHKPLNCPLESNRIVTLRHIQEVQGEQGGGYLRKTYRFSGQFINRIIVNHVDNGR